jgi:lipopolysaccharide export system protein LptA
VALGERDLAASGGVKSVLKASRPGGTGAVRRPSVLRADQAVNVTADRLDYARAAGRATYTGQARLWQGETAIQGATIVLDDVRGNLSASDDVRSTLRLDDTDPKTGRTERKTTVITAGRMVYEDETRLAVYTIDARLSGPDGEMRAPKIELYLDADGSALERAEAYEDVSLRSVRRSSFGTRLTYFAAEGRYLMRGAPVRVYEQLPGECRETLGRTLTFFRSTDSISVDGNEESRTRTTTGGKCPVAPVG